jgi:hypothetical protein
MSKARDLADFISTGSILSDGTIESTEISGVTADATEINKLDGLTADTTELNKLDGVTATTAELNKLAGTTATTSDFDKLSNVTASATELNYMTGATSSIQSQLDNISVTSGSLTKTFTNGESATITLAQSITPAPVVSVTKEIAQTGQSSKGAWDVNATASNYDLHNTAYATTLTPSTTVETDVDTATYASVSTSVTGSDVQGGFFKPDGTKFYTSGGTTLYEYSLSTAWDVTTKTQTNSYDHSTELGNARGIYFKPDGTRVWLVGNSVNVYRFDLSTAWDLSTISYSNSFYSINANNSNGAQGIIFKSDGTKYYVVDYTYDRVSEYTMSTAWDIETTTHSTNFSVSSQMPTPKDLQFTSDGTIMYVNEADNAYEYTLSTAWDLSTASYANRSLSLSGGTNSSVQGMFLRQDGPELFFFAAGSYVYEYNFSSTSVVTLGTGSFASTDVGKRIQGNGGDVILTSTAGAYDTTGGSDFTDTSTIASGSWTMHGLKSAGADDGLTIAGIVSNPTLNTLDVFNDNSCQYLLELDNDLLDTGGNYNASGSNSFNTGSKYGTHAFYTGSGNNFISQINQPENSGWMMSFWFRRDGIGSIGTNNRMVDFKENTSSQGTTITFNGDNQFHFVLRANAHGNGSRALGGASICDDAWHHIVVGSGNGSTVRAYVDGVAITGDSGVVRSDSHEGTGILWGTGFGGNLTNSYFDQIRYFNRELTASEVLELYDEAGSTAYIPTSQYHIGVTNVGGQIDTTTWQDINSMTADQNLNAGEAYYAVSTDDRTTWSVAKASDGVRPIVRNNAGTWQYNSQESSATVGWDVVNGTYDNKNRFLDGTLNGFEISNDGTKIYYVKNNLLTYQRTLSTAYDVSTAGAESSVATNSQDGDPRDVTLSADGTKMYLLGDTNNTIFQYTLSTAWDITTATYASKSFNMTSQDTSPFSLEFKYDGTRMWVLGNNTKYIYQFDLSTAWDVSTASYNNVSFLTTSAGLVSAPKGIVVKSDGSELYMIDSDYDRIRIYEFGTDFDLSTLTYSNNSFDHTGQTTNPRDVTFSADGQKMYVLESANYVYQYSTDTTAISYSTSTTWTDATTNDEFYALQQALGATSVNRMDKTQLDAVADGSHFTLGDTLDLMIALKQDTSTGFTPNSDGVSINYDAEALNQGAVLGTDYDFDFPANNKVRITSNAAQNLKIRVV